MDIFKNIEIIVSCSEKFTLYIKRLFWFDFFPWKDKHKVLLIESTSLQGY